VRNCETFLDTNFTKLVLKACSLNIIVYNKRTVFNSIYCERIFLYPVSQNIAVILS
jgi:hypothetical protein